MVFRSLVLLIGIGAISQHDAQPIDTLFARLRGLPIDSLEARERAATDPRMKMVAINRLTGQYAFVGRTEDCMKAAMQGLELAETIKNDTLLAMANFGIGVAFTRLNDVNGALKHFNIAFDGYQQIGDSMRMSLVCKETAIVYQQVGDIDGTLRYMRKAQAYGLGEGFYGRSMSILARCHMDRGDLDSALYYARLADVMKEPGTDPYGYAAFKLTMAVVHAARGENDVAEPYYKRALAVADSAGTLDALIGGSAGYARASNMSSERSTSRWAACKCGPSVWHAPPSMWGSPTCATTCSAPLPS